MQVPFLKPDITESEIDAVAETMRSGWITTGPKTKQFENELAQFCGTSQVVCLNSGTASLECALRLLDVGPGDEVITTAYTYTSSCSVIVHVGAKPVLVDTFEDSLQMDYSKLEDVITDRTKVIIPVDVGGIMCDYGRIFSILESCKEKFHPTNDLQAAFGRVIVLADGAHSLGATYHGMPSGSVADFTAFSFHAVKNLTTAEGGALTWRDVEGVDGDELYRKAQMLSLHGQSKDALEKTRAGSWEYDIVETAYKWNMTDISASIGLAQLQRFPGMLARRNEILNKYHEALDGPDAKLTLHYTDEGSSSGHLAITRLTGFTEEMRNEFIVKMAEKGVSCNVHYKPLPMLTAYQKLGFSIMNYPNAYDFYRNEVTLPLFTLLTDEQVDYIIDSFLESIKECKN
ncbi:MAG: DegT/DnrJ/EryC1/StrS family aminotransferase [Coriobacteriales bacterium]|jgi:dTDP-4-amino-4,6-dideoxygalactose transaminase